MALRIGPPAGPEDVNARITFFSRDLTYSIVVDHENWMQKYVVNSGINLNKTVVAIIHGFAFDVNMTWMDEMKDALLKKSPVVSYITCTCLLGNFPGTYVQGLDPAGPLFDDDTVALSPDDAQFVDAIHTDSGTLYDLRFGIRKSVGHVDFFPNGGNNQPQCDGTQKSVGATG
ncbi:hypothetical protein HPB50_003386 [Hyalomma asiaticum]|uniref:Uncharacterized protein n=1 Tax=Hyalomma asiaticum TaxID=266040 RepID=A0ACB7RSX9_HYAAI|nr:hypothetical protein HPB50_003386 [Hyalomma asiaticum]